MGRIKRLTNMVGTMLSDKQLEGLTKVTDELEMAKSEFIRKIILEKMEEYEKRENHHEE